jgi:DnaK suppressor protein
MTPEKLAKIKERLMGQFDDVSNEISDHSDRDTLAHSDVEKAIVNSDDRLLEKIELALKRIDDGTYGNCLSCKEKISVERLEAKPAVSLCTTCQEAKERGESQY